MFSIYVTTSISLLGWLVCHAAREKKDDLCLKCSPIEQSKSYFAFIFGSALGCLDNVRGCELSI